jgi:hypothetical protein
MSDHLQALAGWTIVAVLAGIAAVGLGPGAAMLVLVGAAICWAFEP